MHSWERTLAKDKAIGFVGRLLITAFGLWLADLMLAGVRIDAVAHLWAAAFLLGIANTFVRPVIILLTLPFTILSLGLFLFVVNGAMFLLVASVLPSFHVDSMGSAILAWIIVGLTGVFAGSQFQHSRGKARVTEV